MKKQSFNKMCMNNELAKQIASWIYEEDYECYNLPTYEKMKENNYGMLNNKNSNNYICYLKNNEVVAYCNMKEMEDSKVFIGIGLKPAYCGKGLGNWFLIDSLNEAKKRYPTFNIYLEVRSWNIRAIKAYKKVGFAIIKEFIGKDRLGNYCNFTLMELR